MRLRSLAPAAGVLLLCAVCLPATDAGAGPGLSIAVSGNRLVNQNGDTVVLRGANTSGTEYACVNENSIFDGTQEASAGLDRRHAVVGLQRGAGAAQRVVLAGCAGSQVLPTPGRRTSTRSSST